MPLDNCTRNGKAKAAMFAKAFAVRPFGVKPAKHRFAFLFRNARAFIGYPDDNFFIGTGRGHFNEPGGRRE